MLFGQSRKLQDRVLDLKAECEALKTKTVTTTYQNEEAAAALSPSGSKTFAFSSVPPDANLPKAPAMTGPDMANEILKLRRDLEDALSRKDMYKGYWQQSEHMLMRKRKNPSV